MTDISVHLAAMAYSGENQTPRDLTGQRGIEMESFVLPRDAESRMPRECANPLEHQWFVSLAHSDMGFDAPVQCAYCDVLLLRPWRVPEFIFQMGQAYGFGSWEDLVEAAYAEQN